MGEGLKRAGHAARCTQPRSLYLTLAQRQMLRWCVRVATENGDAFRGHELGTEGYVTTQRILNDLSFKLDDKNYR